MINYIKRKNLDILKYNTCVEKSIYSKIYAFSWYLDIVSDNWDVLVLNDYEAVMPIPWNSKFGLKYISQPYFCQQINVYSVKEVELDVFIKKLPYYFLLTQLHFSTKPEQFKVNNKQNYSLTLNKKYLEIYSNYRKDRKKSLKKSIEAELTFKDFDNKTNLINLYRKVFEDVNNSEKCFFIIEEIISFCLKNKFGFIRNVYKEEELICSGFFAVYKNKIYYLFAASNTVGKKYGATTFLINSVIKQYSNSSFEFDFEGSTIPNTASFYKSFGSDISNYYSFNTNILKRVFI